MNDAPQGMPVFIAKDNIREIVIMAIREWAAEYPDDVRIFNEQMIFERQSLLNVSGVSKDKVNKKIMEIPAKLAAKIQRMTERDWLRDSKVLTVLYEEFKVGRVGHKTGKVQST